MRDRFPFWIVLCLAAGALSATGDGVGLRSAVVHQPQVDAAATSNELQIVKFAGPPTPAQLAALADVATEVYTYLPDHAFLVRVDPGRFTAAAIGAGWSAPYLAEYAISPEVARSEERGDPTLRPVLIHLLPDADLLAVTAAVEELVGRPIAASASRVRFGRIRVLLSDGELAAVRHQLAALPGVFWLEREARRSFSNNTSVWVGQSGTTGGQATPVFSHGLFGEGQIVGVLDTGIDIDSCYFWDAANGLPAMNACDQGTTVESAQRKVIAVDFLWANECAGGISNTEWDTQNHGTHVAGTVAGHNTVSPGASDRNGMAPAAKLVVQDCGFQTDNCADCPGIGCAVVDLNPIFQQAFDQGARIHTNSWGDEENDPAYGQYTAGSQDADEFMWNHKDFLLVFAAGNNGGTSNTVDSPSTAKSVVSVGSTLRGASADTISGFSSRGPTDDGRIKPDLTQPGSSIESAGNSGGITNFNCTNATSSGTSMAAPGVAGLAALVRQYYMDGFYPTGAANGLDAFTPTAALTKATLINSATQMTGEGNIPNGTQGWGRVTLDEALYFPGDARRLWVEDDQVGFTAAAEIRTYTLNVASAEPLEVTLAWTDYPSTPAAATNLVNDLDLEVSGPDGLFRGNVYSGGQSTIGGSADRLNSVESVLLSSPTPGLWTITVRSFTVPQGPQPFAVLATGDVSACGGVASAQAVAGSESFIPDGSGDADGVLDNCESGRVAFSVANLGLAVASNTAIVGVSSPSHPAVAFETPTWSAGSIGSCDVDTSAYVDIASASGLTFGDTLLVEVETTNDEIAPATNLTTLVLTPVESDQIVSSRTFDFESTLEDWSATSGTFVRASAGGGAEGTSWYMQSSANLDNRCDAVLSPEVVLSPTSTMTLWSWYGIEAFSSGQWWDRANVSVVDAGTSALLTPSSGRAYDVPPGSGNGTCGTAGEAGWAGSQTSWAESGFDAAALDAMGLAGRPVQFDVRYGTDSSVNGPGFRFDRLTVTDIVETVADAQPDCSSAIFADGFESGDATAWSATVP